MEEMCDLKPNSHANSSSSLQWSKSGEIAGIRLANLKHRLLNERVECANARLYIPPRE